MTEKKKNDFLSALSKIIRVVTAPAILAVLVAAVLCFEREAGEPFYEYFLFALFIGIIPILSYPICRLIPKLREKGRDFERKMSFVTSVIGYTAGFVYALIAPVPRTLLVAYVSYFASVVILTFFNKVVKVRASGHACGIFGPLLLVVLLCGLKYLAPCVLILAGVVFSSLYLKRHTVTELVFGALSSGIPVLVSWLLLIRL